MKYKVEYYSAWNVMGMSEDFEDVQDAVNEAKRAKNEDQLQASVLNEDLEEVFTTWPH